MLKKLSSRIISAEIYYEPRTTELSVEIEGARYFDIVTMEEV